jgi:hypothetical protein
MLFGKALPSDTSKSPLKNENAPHQRNDEEFKRKRPRDGDNENRQYWNKQPRLSHPSEQSISTHFYFICLLFL